MYLSSQAAQSSSSSPQPRLAAASPITPRGKAVQGLWGTPDAVITGTPEKLDEFHTERRAMPYIPAFPQIGISGSESQLSKMEINEFFERPSWDFFRNECLREFRPGDSSLSNPATSELRFHGNPSPGIDSTRAFKMHLLLEFMWGMEVSRSQQCEDLRGLLSAQVLDISLVKDQEGKLKLLLFSNMDSKLLYNLCDTISNRYGIPIEYPQLDPNNYDKQGNKHPSICVDENTRVPDGVFIKNIADDELHKINSNNYGTVAKQTFLELGDGYENVYETLIKNGVLHRIDENNARLAIPKETLDDKLKDFLGDQNDGVLPILQQSYNHLLVGKHIWHCEQRAQQYIENKVYFQVHHANTQTSFCDENVLMRETGKIPVLKIANEQDFDNNLKALLALYSNPHQKRFAGQVDRLIRNIIGQHVFSSSGVQGLRGSDIEVSFDKEMLSEMVQRYSQASAAEKPQRVEEIQRELQSAIIQWHNVFSDPVDLTNRLMHRENRPNITNGACQCCRIALRGRSSAGSFIQDIPGEIPVKFAQSDGAFKPVLDNMVQNGFLELERREQKTYVFTTEYTNRALAAESRESFIGRLANDLNVEIQDLTNFFELDFFAHLRGTLVPWPLPKGRQSRILPLDHAKINNTAMLDKNSDQLDLKTLLEKRSALNQTGDLTILDTRDAEREGVSEMLAYRLGASLLNEGESDGNNAVQLEYVLDYGKRPSTYKVILQHKRDGNLGISKIERVGARDSLVIVFPAVSPSDREGQ